ncbi:hypothetical protein ASH00_07775 [Arthrobacter sp. Soil782]|uniref:DUF4192 domain-containing protein n=1 Tax=Arthrobacter sp. Soil782 TaxID=1736410 RepID=UPI0006FB1809|nr:DUF4192 domain-containing protein [Arthrobacter sp. Soil782]KRF06155.1 hypothetical protein ASH00_07775 [Arthrobacter sp. Soil782]
MTANAPRPEAPIKVSTPADILSYVPHILGFQPKESLVFLTMSGKRVGATLRLDLPLTTSDPLDYASTVRDYLESDSSADGVLMAVYTDAEWAEPGSPPYAPLIHCLDLVLDAAGLPLLDGWLVSSSHWRDYFCEDASCCPWPGHPLARITESVLNAELVYQGSTYAASLAAAVGTPDPGHSEEINQLAASYVEQWCGRWDKTSLGRDSLILWDAFLSRTADPPEPAVSPQVVAFLLAGLTSAPLRDSLIVLAAAGSDAAQEAAVAAGVLPADPEEEQLPYACDALMTGLQALRPTGGLPRPADREDNEDPSTLFRDVFLATLSVPDWDRLDAAHTRFLGLTAVASGEPRAALLSILGWLEWARGRGSRAHYYLQEALDEAPGYTLAELLMTLVGTGSLAPWARRRETAWTSESRSAA